MKNMSVETDSRFQLTFNSDSDVEKSVVEYLSGLPTNQRSIEARQLALDGFRLVRELMEQDDQGAFNIALLELSKALGLDGDEIRQYLGLPACIMRQRIDIKDIIKKRSATRNLAKNETLSRPDFTKNEGESNELEPNSIETAYHEQSNGAQQSRGLIKEKSISDYDDKSIVENSNDELQNDLKKLVQW
ncbi:hypothetical protein [Citrobacter freundii]|uniref:hypothetical protein n=1 Tax=Citrobacter freundii TaxID=546 RepID=UPI001908E69B|nr:hypothetical protein [Citrobacter freundii]MBJ8931588.1 hypothetical protein [Citrobacter freundii]